MIGHGRGTMVDSTLAALAATLVGVGTSGVSGQVACEDDGWRERDRDRVCEVREQMLPAEAALEVDGGANGGITIEGWDRDEIRLRAKVWADADSESRAAALVEEIRVVVERGRVHADGPRRERRESWGVTYELMVPHDTDLDLHASNGGIAVANTSGETRFRTTNGGVHLEGLSGDVEGRTTNGGLHVDLTGTEWTGRGLDVETTNGGVRLTIPDDYSAELETGTVNGGIEVDFPVTVQGRIGRSIRTTLGDGGATVRVMTTNGGVRIQQRGERIEQR